MGNKCGKLEEGTPHHLGEKPRRHTATPYVPMGTHHQEGQQRRSVTFDLSPSVSQSRGTDPTAHRSRKLSFSSRHPDDVILRMPSSKSEPAVNRPATVPHPRRLRRSNSTSSLFVSQTMEAPDNGFALKCLARIVMGMLKRDSRLPAVVIGAFEPSFDQARQLGLHGESSIPSIKEVYNWIRNLFVRAQLSDECPVIALAYLYRLVRATKVTVSPSNWRHLIFGSFLLASKVWDDLSMINRDFGVVCPLFTLEQINKLEIELLHYLDWNVLVSNAEYAKFYFILREVSLKVNKLPKNVLEKKDAIKLHVGPNRDELDREGLVPPRLRRKVTCDETTLHFSRPLAILS